MTEELYQKLNDFKKMMENDPRIILLNQKEKEMNESKEVMALAYKKDMAAVNYSDTLNHFSRDSDEAKEAMKKLHAAKLELDNHPLVREYLEAYKQVRALYEEINGILFKDFNIDLCPKEK